MYPLIHFHGIINGLMVKKPVRNKIDLKVNLKMNSDFICTLL